MNLYIHLYNVSMINQILFFDKLNIKIRTNLNFVIIIKKRYIKLFPKNLNVLFRFISKKMNKMLFFSYLGLY